VLLVSLIIPGFFLLLLAFPGLIINPVSIKYVRPFLPLEEIYWEKLDVQFEYSSFLVRPVQISGQSLVINTGAGSTKLKSFDFKLILNLSQLTIQVKKVHADAKIVLLEKGRKNSRVSFLPDQFHLTIIQRIMRSNLKLVFEVGMQNKLFEGQLTGHLNKNKALHSKVSYSDGSKSYSLSSLASLHKNILTGFTSISLPDVTGKIEFQNSNENLSGTFTVEITKGSLNGKFNCSGQLEQNKTKLELSGHLQGIPVSLNKSELNLYGSISKDGIKIITEGNFLPAINGIKQNNDALNEYIPSEMTVRLSGKSEIYSTQSGLNSTLKNRVIFSQKGNSLLKVSGYLAHEMVVTDTVTQRVNSDLKLKILNLKKLFDSLKKTEFEVPAPLNQFDGALDCSLDDMKGEIANPWLRLKCSADLASGTQNVLLDGDLNIFPKTKTRQQTNIKGNLNIKNAILKLPRLSITEKIPTFSIDSRIVLNKNPQTIQPKTTQNPPPFTYDIRLLSKARNLLVQSDLLSKPIPIAVDLNFSDSHPPSGAVSIYNHEIDFFRRKAEVKKLQMILAHSSEVSEIDGEIHFRESNHNISMKIFGNTKKPQYLFDSKPFLEQEDIVSMLLFGKQASELSDLNLSSVNSTRNAVADRAINLLSMYFLASSPVDSVDYNPEDGVLSAKVSLGNGTAISLGKNSSSKKTAKIQQILGENWIIETSYSDLGQNQKKASGMLKWAIRY